MHGGEYFVEVLGVSRAAVESDAGCIQISGDVRGNGQSFLLESPSFHKLWAETIAGNIL